MHSLDQQIIQLYREGYGMKTIADKLNTYPAKVQRTLNKHNEPTRTKTEAQKSALQLGTAKHPTAGIKRDEKLKAQIGDAVSKSWKKLSQDELNERSDKSKQAWNRLGPDKRAEIQAKSAKAVRKAAAEGSKMEKLLYNLLIKDGYSAILHKRRMVVNTQMEIDLLLPELGVAIEVDGLSHFSPIWGQEALRQRKRSDATKNGLLIQAGYKVIRLQILASTATKCKSREVYSKLKNLLESTLPEYSEVICE